MLTTLLPCVQFAFPPPLKRRTPPRFGQPSYLSCIICSWAARLASAKPSYFLCSALCKAGSRRVASRSHGVMAWWWQVACCVNMWGRGRAWNGTC